jgi:hypothetical protein
MNVSLLGLAGPRPLAAQKLLRRLQGRAAPLVSISDEL